MARRMQELVQNDLDQLFEQGPDFYKMPVNTSDQEAAAAATAAVEEQNRKEKEAAS